MRPDTNYNEWTPCQLYGHQFEFRCGDCVQSGVSKYICNDCGDEYEDFENVCSDCGRQVPDPNRLR